MEMNRPSASAHRRSPTCSVPVVKILRPSTRSKTPVMRSSVVQRRRRPVVDGEAAGHARGTRERLRRAEHLVERGRDVAAVDATGRAFVGGAEGGDRPPSCARRRPAARSAAPAGWPVRASGCGRRSHAGRRCWPPPRILRRSTAPRSSRKGRHRLELVGSGPQVGLVGIGHHQPVEDPPRRVGQTADLGATR